VKITEPGHHQVRRFRAFKLHRKVGLMAPQIGRLHIAMKTPQAYNGFHAAPEQAE
jgi:hypothetical protein